MRAAGEAGKDPDRLSFANAERVMRHQITNSGAFPQRTSPTDVIDDIPEERSSLSRGQAAERQAGQGGRLPRPRARSAVAQPTGLDVGNCPESNSIGLKMVSPFRGRPAAASRYPEGHASAVMVSDTARDHSTLRFQVFRSRPLRCFRPEVVEHGTKELDRTTGMEQCPPGPRRNHTDRRFRYGDPSMVSGVS